MSISFDRHSTVLHGVTVAFAADSGGASGSGSSDTVFVVAEIEVRPGTRGEFAEIFKNNVPNVHAEDGCIMYEPVVDRDTVVGAQAPLRDNVMTVMEKWASLDALKAHMQAPHMNAYNEQVKDLVTGVTIRVMQSA